MTNIRLTVPLLLATILLTGCGPAPTRTTPAPPAAQPILPPQCDQTEERHQQLAAAREELVAIYTEHTGSPPTTNTLRGIALHLEYNLPCP